MERDLKAVDCTIYKETKLVEMKRGKEYEVCVVQQIYSLEFQELQRQAAWKKAVPSQTPNRADC